MHWHRRAKNEWATCRTSSDTRMHVATSTVDRLVDYCLHTPSDGLTTAASVERLNELIDRNLDYERKNNR